MQVTVEEANTILPELCELTRTGLGVIITKDGQPLMRLVPLERHLPAAKPERTPGTLQGKIWMSPDFDEPLDFSIDLTGSEEQV